MLVVARVMQGAAGGGLQPARICLSFLLLFRDGGETTEGVMVGDSGQVTDEARQVAGGTARVLHPHVSDPQLPEGRPTGRSYVHARIGVRSPFDCSDWRRIPGPLPAPGYEFPPSVVWSIGHQQGELLVRGSVLGQA
jgi:hypothetical protein